jgi:hypothetical protein
MHLISHNVQPTTKSASSSPFMSRRDGIPWGKGEVRRGMGGGRCGIHPPIPTPALPLKGREMSPG